MIRETIRNYQFEGKKEDFSITHDYRVQSTKKTILDLIKEFSQLDESTTFKIHDRKLEKIIEFSKDDFNADNVELTLRQASKDCEHVIITESILKCMKNEKNPDIQVSLINYRLVEIE